MTETFKAAVAIVGRDARLFYSYRFRAVITAGSTIIVLALFRELSDLVSTRHFATPAAYFDYAAVGLAVLPALRFVLTITPANLRDELIAGTFDQFGLAAFGPTNYLLCTLIFPMVTGFVFGAFTIAVAAAVFGLHLSWPSALLALPLSPLVALALAPIAAVLLAGTVLVKQVTSGSSWLVSGISLLAGTYFPVALLPGWIRWMSDLLPLTPALALLRHVLVGTPTPVPVLEELARLAAFAAAGLPIAVLATHLACAAARSRGTLLEY